MAIAMSNSQTLIKKIQSLPPDRIAEVEDFVDFLKERVIRQKSATSGTESLDFPIDDLGPWPEGMGLRREDIYDDNGR
jgi:hypothetical protein